MADAWAMKWGDGGEDMEAALEAQMAGIVGSEAEGGAPTRIFQGGFQPRKMCQHYGKGTCHKGDQCTFAHTAEELHPSALAAGAADGGADFGAAQLQAGGTGEPGASEHCFSSLQGPRDFSATGKQPYLLCQFWLRHPMSCSKGDNCTYAHGLSECGLEGHGLKELCNTLAQVVQEGVKGGKGTKGFGKEQQKGGVDAWGKGADPWGGGYQIAVGGKGKGMGGKAVAPATTGSWGKAGGKGGQGGRAAFFAGKGFTPSKMCTVIAETGVCNFGDRCTFAHSEDELKGGGKGGGGGGVDLSWQWKGKGAAGPFGAGPYGKGGKGPMGEPAAWSGKKTKMCTFFEQGLCSKSPCTFAHSADELEI